MKWLELDSKGPPARAQFLTDNEVVHRYTEPVSRARITLYYDRVSGDLFRQAEILGGGERWFTVERKEKYDNR